MEKLKNKHDHKLTNVLKAVIFSIVMLAPFFAVMSKCLYVSFNKNAYESWSGTTYKELQPIYYETNNVENINDIISGHAYRLELNAESNISEGNIIIVLFDKLLSYNYEHIYDTTQVEYNTPYLVKSSTSMRIRINNETINNNLRFIGNGSLDFVFNSNVQNLNYLIPYISECPTNYVKEYIEVTQNLTLDNVFYYAVEDLKNEKLFNWTEDTAIYSAINTMCTGLDVQGGVLPLLLTYWALMTAIYIVFDIIIVVFVKLTHFME